MLLVRVAPFAFVCHTERAISCMSNWGQSAWCVSQLTRARINTDKRLLLTAGKNVFVKEKTQRVCFHLLFHVPLLVGKIKQMLFCYPCNNGVHFIVWVIGAKVFDVHTQWDLSRVIHKSVSCPGSWDGSPTCVMVYRISLYIAIHNFIDKGHSLSKWESWHIFLPV